jgi:uncharacterized protein (DUF1697 family)
MITYLALLRGVNVGGRNIIKMDRLKACFDESGFQQAATFIQSGNVVFGSGEKSVRALEKSIEMALSKTFNYPSTVVVRSLSQLRQTLAEVPPLWKKRGDLRCNIAFVKAPVTAAQVLQEIDARAGVDFVQPGKGVVYMATLLSDVKKSALPKLVTKKSYQDLTIRNYNSCQRLLALMESR